VELDGCTVRDVKVELKVELNPDDDGVLVVVELSEKKDDDNAEVEVDLEEDVEDDVGDVYDSDVRVE
jgi:hypothetical protein